MITKSITDSGIRIVTETIPHSHSATIGLWVCNGSRHENAAHNGIAHFIEHLLFKGTSTRSALDIAREIDSLGGVLNAFTGREYVCYYAKVLDRYVQRAASLLTDIFTDSQFNSAEIERERQVILQEIGMLEDTPDVETARLDSLAVGLNHMFSLRWSAYGKYSYQRGRSDYVDTDQPGGKVTDKLVPYIPLHTAVLYGRLEVAQFLIEKGAEISAKSSSGATPLSIAA